ncbi:MAG: polysaccharide deacetylase family protein [Candidatus Calescibacterium sp.]|nr:polysaccharide deacetylase family protein [Candidatus Calescibacterium sp.]
MNDDCIKVYVPNNFSFTNEVKYVFDFLLQEYRYDYQFHHGGDYLLVLPNHSKIVIKDSFFYKYSRPLDFLKKENIPQKITLYQNQQISQQDVIVLFGCGETTISRLGDYYHLDCKIDLVASVFFMLSRWEEYLPGENDDKNRLKSSETTPVRLGFVERPVVEEWKRFLEDMITFVCPSYKVFKKNFFQVIPTHDIDIIYYPKSLINFAADVLVARSWYGPIIRLSNILMQKNPFDTFSFLMDQSEKAGLKSIFYLMGDGRSPLDTRYDGQDPFVQRFVKEIINRGHIIGFHPGCDTYNNQNEFIRQLNYVENYCNLKINISRQHRLKYKLPDSLEVWENCGIVEDSSIGYYDYAGFRCGTGRKFKLFHVLYQKETNVYERPLIFMDTQFHDYKMLKKLREEGIKKLYKLDDICRKFHCDYTILFHNSNFDSIRWPGWKKAYEKYFTYLSNHN